MASETASAGAGVDGYEAEASEAEEERLESGTLRFTVVAPDGAKLPIEVATCECVLALRTALAELPATAHFTSYKLLLQNARPPSKETAIAAAAAKAAGAPATLWEVSDDGSVELNDVLELLEYAGAGLEDGCTVAMVRAPYDARAARVHLKCLNDLLLHPPAAVPSPAASHARAVAAAAPAREAARAAAAASAAATAHADALSAAATAGGSDGSGSGGSEKSGSSGSSSSSRQALVTSSSSSNGSIERDQVRYTERDLRDLHRQAQRAAQRLEVHRRESDRIVCQRMPCLEPPPSSSSSPPLVWGGFGLGPSSGAGLGAFYDKALGPACLDHRDRHLSAPQAALIGLAAYDATLLDDRGTSGASSSSSSSSAQAAVAASLALDVGSGNALSESTDLGSSSSDAVLEKKKKRRNKNNNSGGGGVSSSGSSGSTSSGVDAASTLGALRGSQLATVCSSGFNPPPPHRKLAGDLIYLEVRFPSGAKGKSSGDKDYEEVLHVHVTGTSRGWFLNGSKTTTAAGARGATSAAADGFLLPSPSAAASSALSLPHFDPLPATDPITNRPIASPELLGLLVLASPRFKASWQAALEASAAQAAGHEDPLAMIGLMVAEGRADAVVIKPTWCLPPTTNNTTTSTTLPSSSSPGSSSSSRASSSSSSSSSQQAHLAHHHKKHEWNQHRLEEDLSSSPLWGGDERGALRDWNEEFQCYHELPATTLMEKINRAKMIYKVWLEFQDAACLGAAAISGGHVPPINGAEPSRQHVYVFNGTFFSYGVDSKDAYKVIGGDDAACKSARHDFRNVQLLEHLQFTCNAQPQTPQAAAALEAYEKEQQQQQDGEAPPPTAAAAAPGSPRLCTLLTALVDLPCAGRRLVAQSIIPGILSGDQVSKLVFGAIEHGVPLASDSEMATLLSQAADCLHVATRAAPAIPLHAAPFSEDERGDDGEREGGVGGGSSGSTSTSSGNASGDDASSVGTVSLSGAVELKGIIGSDNRKYVLDLLRLTPRDANWMPQPLGGTGKWEAAAAALQAAHLANDGHDSSFEGNDSFLGAAAVCAAGTARGAKNKGAQASAAPADSPPHAFAAWKDNKKKQQQQQLQGRSPASSEDSPELELEMAAANGAATSGSGAGSGGNRKGRSSSSASSSQFGSASPTPRNSSSSSIPGSPPPTLSSPLPRIACSFSSSTSGRDRSSSGGNGGRNAPPTPTAGGKSLDYLLAQASKAEAQVAMASWPLSNDHVALLRPELVARWRRRQQELRASNGEGALPCEDKIFDLEPLNVNVFMPFECAADPSEAASDEERARKVAKWLWDVVLPTITKEVRRGGIVPLDGAVLVEALHSFGVNARYMGRLAALAETEEARDLFSARLSQGQEAEQGLGVEQGGEGSGDGQSSSSDAAAASAEAVVAGLATPSPLPAGSPPFPLFWRRMLEVEMVVRASKHVLGRLMDSQPHLRAAPATALAAFLNHLLGSGLHSPSSSSLSSSGGSGGSSSSKKKKKKGSNSSSAATAGGSSSSSGSTGGSGGSGSSSAGGVGKADSSDPLDEKHLWSLCSSVVAPEPPLPEGLASSQALWTLIAAEVRARFRHELSLWPNPATKSASSAAAGAASGGASSSSSSSSSSTSAVPPPSSSKEPSWSSSSSSLVAHAAAAEAVAAKPALLRRLCQKLGLRLRAAPYNFRAPQPFAVGDVIDAVPVPKSCGGAGPPGWVSALFQRSGPLAWLMEDPAHSSSAASENKKGDGSSSNSTSSSSDGAATSGAEAPAAASGDGGESPSSSSSSSSSSSHALSPLPFGNGSGTGSGGHPCLVPCPLTDVDELLAMAQLQAHGQQWASVYELAQQAFALSQAVSGPLHRATAIALEFVAKALFYLGDPEVAVGQQTKALAIHQQLGGFDTPDVAAAHVSLATYHHKLGQVEALREPSMTGNDDGKEPGDEEGANADEGQKNESSAAAGADSNSSSTSSPSSSASQPASGTLNLDRRLDKAARHMGAAAYLFELLGGPLHPETVDAYQKLGQYYHEASLLAAHHGFPAPAMMTSSTDDDVSSNNGGPDAAAASAASAALKSATVGSTGWHLAVAALRCYRESSRRSCFASLATNAAAKASLISPLSSSSSSVTEEDLYLRAEAAAAQAVLASPIGSSSSGSSSSNTSSPSSSSSSSSSSPSSWLPYGGIPSLEVPLLGNDIVELLVFETEALAALAATASSSSSDKSLSSSSSSSPSSSSTLSSTSSSSSSAAAAAPPPTPPLATGGSAGGAAYQPAMLQKILAAQAMHTMALLYERPLSLGKEALRLEKAAFKVYRMLLGDKHHLTVTSASYMQRFTDASVRSLTAAKRLKQLEGAALLQQNASTAGASAASSSSSSNRQLNTASAAAANNQKDSSSGSGQESAAHAGNALAAADAMAAVLAGLEADAAPSATSGGSSNNRKGRKAK